ncbi:MAG: hypothetical protein KatS3mg087_1185 [Patescibacteria group bacterium]|nr:MAG: hypothetical protein KatS3mg087_1185 [Patescibacteria group bacterium]
MASELEVQRLVARLVGDVSSYVSSMQSAEKVANTTAAAISQSLLQAQRFSAKETALLSSNVNRYLSSISKTSSLTGAQIAQSFSAASDSARNFGAVILELDKQFSLFAAKARAQSVALQSVSSDLSGSYHQVSNATLSYASILNQSARRSAQFQAALSQVKSTLNSVALDATLAGTAMSVIFGVTARQAINLAAASESMKVSFETMLGSAEEAQETLARLVDFSARTPFQLPEILQASRMLIQFGERGDEMMDTMVLLGNAAAATQTDFGTLALIFNQIRGVGKLLTQDFRQLATRGVISLQDIAKHFGVTTAKAQQMLSEGMISFEDVRDILRNLSAEGGRFANQMEKQSQTLSGLFSTLKDNINITLGKIGEEMGKILKPILSALIKVINFFNSAGSGIFVFIAAVIGVGAAMGIVLGSIGAFVFTLFKLLAVLGAVVKIVGVVGAAIAALGAPVLAVVGVVTMLVAGLVALGVAIYRLTLRQSGYHESLKKSKELNDQVLNRINKNNAAILEQAKSLQGISKRLFLAEQIGKAEREIQGTAFQIKLLEKQAKEAEPTWRSLWLVGRENFAAINQELEQTKQRMQALKDFRAKLQSELDEARKQTEPSEEALEAFRTELNNVKQELESIGMTELEKKIAAFEKQKIPVDDLEQFKKLSEQLELAKRIQEANKEMQDMRKELERIGLSKREQLELDLRQRNLTVSTINEYLQLFDQLEAAKKRQQAIDEANKAVENLKEEIALLGKSEEQRQLMKLAEMGVSQAKLNEIQALQQELARRKELLSLQEQANRIIEDNRSEVEKLQKRYDELLQLQKLGFFDKAPGAFRKEVTKISNELKGIEERSKINISFNFDELQVGTTQFFQKLQQQIQTIRGLGANRLDPEAQAARELRMRIEGGFNNEQAKVNKESVNLLKRIAENTDKARGITFVSANL